MESSDDNSNYKRMKQQSKKKLTERQRRYMQFVEDRFELLDTIREMIDIEFDRRGISPDGNPHPENPPPDPKGREPSEAKTEEPNDRPCRTLWKRIVSLFTVCL